MVHVSNMTDDYYHFDERQMAMIGERQAKVFRIGDPVKIKVINVDVDERMIDFQIVGMPLRLVIYHVFLLVLSYHALVFDYCDRYF